MILSSLFQRGRCERAKNRTRDRAAERFRLHGMADVDAHTFHGHGFPAFPISNKSTAFLKTRREFASKRGMQAGHVLDGEATEGQFANFN
jgi:hypothetical protein